MKRFYKLVSTHAVQGGFEIHLDTRPVKTPMKQAMVAPNEPLANAIQAEWAAQEEAIKPDTMPLTQILSTQIDRIGNERKAIQASLLKYLDTDLLCYRADKPPALITAQSHSWDKHLDWFAEKFAAKLEITNGLSALTQDKAVHDAVKEYVDNLDDAHFNILQLVSSLAGSLVLAIASLHGKIDAKEIFAAMRVEESFKAEIYNEDFYGQDPAQEQKDIVIRNDLTAALEFLSLL